MGKQTRFAVSVRAFAEKTGARMDTVVRKVTLELFKRVVLRSPVDTGRFRGAWEVMIGGAVVKGGTIPALDKTGASTILAAATAVRSIQAGQQATILNRLPYGPRLEDGWSKQAPAGMVALALVEFSGIVSVAASEARRG